jgi:iron complex outermembrane recepter protein
MIKRHFYFSFLLMCFLSVSSGVLKGQSLTITVQDEKKSPLPAAVVRIIYQADSSTLSTFTNGEGTTRFEYLKPGLYAVVISHVGYAELEKTVLIKTEPVSLKIQMDQRVSELDAFTVKATRPLIRQEDDKMIIDPEPLANSSTNTLEVLESTPGLFVDQDGGIYLNSATPAVVYINGREQKMSNQDINTILRSLPPGSVQRIEVLRTPSTKYDAASSGGIINIVLKQGVKIGRFGSATAGMNQGVYGNRFAGFTLNNSTDKSTMYLNTNLAYNDQWVEIDALRLLQTDTNMQQSSGTRNTGKEGYIGYGIAYDISETRSLNYDGRVSLSLRDAGVDNLNTIYTAELTELLRSENHTENSTLFSNIQQDFGYKVKLDTAGSEWDTKAGYSWSRGTTDQLYQTDFTIPVTFSQAGEGNNLQQRHFLTMQTDLIKKLPFRVTLETGAKGAWQFLSSDADFFTSADDSLVTDPRRTNAYSYTEQIHAGYAQASRELPLGFLLKAGVRMEHTRMEGRQSVPTDTSFLVNRFDWFPYVYLSRKVFSMGEVELRGFLIYRKTINRPGYQSLNPYIRFIDQFLYETGNPSLKPQFTENIEFNISFNEFPVLAVGRNETTDIFASVVYQDPENELIAIRTFDNLGKSHETYFRGMVGIPPGGKYFFMMGAQYNMNHYTGFYEGEPLDYQRDGWRLFTFHSLTLFKETRITMFGFLMHKGSYNFYELEIFGALNFGINQTFFKKKLHISLSARDVLRSMGTDFTLNLGSMNTTGSRYADSRRFGINIRYNFGIKDREEKRAPFGMPSEEMNGQ